MSNLRKILFILSSVFIIHLKLSNGLGRLKCTQIGRLRLSSKVSTENPSYRRKSELKCDEYIQKIAKRIESKTKRRRKPSHAVGGRPTTPGEFPHMGAVGWKALNGTWIFICGSSLISSKFMLTAAHCSKLSSRYPNIAKTTPEIVRLGDKNIADAFIVNRRQRKADDVEIRRIIVHPQYASPKKYFDIAIIELQRRVYYSKLVQPACLWTRTDTTPLGRKATLTGWGVIETATLETSPELQAAVIDILGSEVCDNLLKPLCNRYWCGMYENQLCAGKLSGGVDSCQGDSGGPLQVKINLTSDSEGSMHYLIGVTSFGNGCARVNTPAIYTRVSSFIDWIEGIVWSAEEEKKEKEED